MSELTKDQEESLDRTLEQVQHYIDEAGMEVFGYHEFEPAVEMAYWKRLRDFVATAISELEEEEMKNLETNCELGTVELSGGLYVVGQGMLFSVKDQAEADQLIAELTDPEGRGAL